MSSLQSTVVIGNGLLAMLTVLMLNRKQGEVTWVNPPESAPTLFNPEVMFIGGDDNLPGLLQYSLNRWKQLSGEISLPPFLATGLAADLATSPGREAILREEAVVDALGGESATYTQVLPEWLANNAALGLKLWPQAAHLVPELPVLLQTALTNAGNVGILNLSPTAIKFDKTGQPEVQFATTRPISCTHVVVAHEPTMLALCAAQNLSLPLRPARGHVLTLQTEKPHGLPMVLHRLSRGHAFFIPTKPDEVELHYDAINDPTQATFTAAPSPKLAAALHRHAQLLFPALAASTLTRVRTVTHWVTPDFLPALGLWGSLPSLAVGVGFGGRGAALAAAAASVLVGDVLTSSANTSYAAFRPERFAGGNWQRTARPGSLTWREGFGGGPDLREPSATYMDNVQFTEKPEAQYASKVNQVEKTIITQNREPATRVEKSKPRIQTAAVSLK